MNRKQGFNPKQALAFIAIICMCLAFPTAVTSQTFRISYINTDNYPVIEAGFVATTSDGIKIYNSKVSDFSIAENNYSNQVLEVLNPKQNYQPVSVVLMVDVSLSMQGRRLALVKDGLKDFIDQLPLEISEIAIASFSDEAYIYTDFTQSRNKLLTAVEKLQSINGTDFNNAFLNESQGAVAIGKNGLNKKTIIFITDGLGLTDAERVASVASATGASVFAINVSLSIPPDLKDLTNRTGGLY
ncbi:MAG TPA: vWA domain-containing protein, partial [Bacteroidales bacterium]|nr:vWA domain-containing protein [Bacteroidales bacterium]